MNFNLGGLSCNDCGEVFICSIGLSNKRTIQKFFVTCKNCEAQSFITLDVQSRKISYDGLVQDKDKKKPLDYKRGLRLHLDFPVFDTPGWVPLSPFMISSMISSDKSIGLHSKNTHLLNVLSENKREIKNIFKFYKNNNWKPLIKNSLNIYKKLHPYTSAPDLPSLKTRENDDNITKGFFFIDVLNMLQEPFLDIEKNEETYLNDEQHLKQIFSSSNLPELFSTLKNDNFFDTQISDINKIYISLLNHEEILRPALFLVNSGINDENNKKKNPFKISIEDFNSISDIFKNITEVLSRSLTFVIGVNNINMRGDFNKFHNNKINTISEYSKLDLATKLKYVDDTWFKNEIKSLDNRIRNSIAHFNWDFDEKDQNIYFYYKNSGLKRGRNKKLNLVDYIIKLIESFRAMHRLNLIYLSVKINIS
ncbi:TPA: hypothetical protein ACV5F9_002185 [Klebsiella michiganensis]